LWIEVTGITRTGNECVPITEICNDYIDNDCDGYVDCYDKDCSDFPDCQPGPTPECDPGAQRECSTGYLGVCATGIQTCDSLGYWEDCLGPSPVIETCDGLDNDCDGDVDENLIQSCPLQLGVCAGANQICTSGVWSSCNYGPYYESGIETTCDDDKDNDCDGPTDCNDKDCAKHDSCLEGPQIFEYYNAGGDSWRQIHGFNWSAQTFTPSTSHTITSVKILASKGGNPGTVTVGIRATSGGNPTSGDLCSGTINGNTFNGSWEEISLSGSCGLSAGTKYAIVVRAPGGDIWNWISWKNETTSATYSGGNYTISTNGGSGWSEDISRDFMFEEWGI
jgi:hypothetical protein